MNIEYRYTYDDLLLKPLFSSVESRSNVSLQTTIGHIKLDIPILSSPMDKITHYDMALEMARLGGMGIVHRFMTIEEQVDVVTRLKNKKVQHIGAAIGSRDYERFEALVKAGVSLICVDLAHGWSVHMKDTVEHIEKHRSRKDITLMGGSVATYDATKDLFIWGVDVVRAVIGEGACCLTRINTGVGVPAMSTNMACRNAVRDFNSDLPDGRVRVGFIADGGIRQPGHCCLALAAGANGIMLGSMLAATDESVGETIMVDGHPHKCYRGCASAEIQKDRGKSDDAVRVEGASRLIPTKGPVKDIIQQICHGIQSCCSYMNAHDLRELRRNSVNRFVRVTPIGASRNGVHI